MYTDMHGTEFYDYDSVRDREQLKELFPLGTLVTDIYTYGDPKARVVGYTWCTRGAETPSSYPEHWCLVVIEYLDDNRHPLTIHQSFLEYFRPLRMDYEVKELDNEREN